MEEGITGKNMVILNGEVFLNGKLIHYGPSSTASGYVRIDEVGLKVNPGVKNTIVIEAAGYGEYFTHSTGHGVGLQIHEKPTLSQKSGSIKLKAGQVVTAEPGIYIPEKFGVRIEDMLQIQKNGCKNLTKAEKQLIIL